jgi:hypothetical protein
MGALEELKVMNVHSDRSAAFANGFTDGKSARSRDEVLSPYLYIGIDDYAKGFRAGFFERIVPPRTASMVTHRVMGE